jgi:hypothetical protein
MQTLNQDTRLPGRDLTQNLLCKEQNNQPLHHYT